MEDTAYEPLVTSILQHVLYVLMFPSSSPCLAISYNKTQIAHKNDNSLTSFKGQIKWCGKYAVVWHIIYIITTKHCTKAVWKIKLHSEENPINRNCREKSEAAYLTWDLMAPTTTFWIYSPLLSCLLFLKHTHTMKLHAASDRQGLRTVTPEEDSQDDKSAAAILVQGGMKQTASFTQISEKLL